MGSTTLRGMSRVAVMLAILLTTSGIVRSENWHPMVLKVTGIEADRGGTIHTFVFLEDGFPIQHEKAPRSYVSPIRGSEATISIEAPVDVPFALKVHHDEDGNNKVTKNWTGIFPAEGFGFSAGARMSMGPPSFADAKMTMPESNAVSIPMRYP